MKKIIVILELFIIILVISLIIFLIVITNIKLPEYLKNFKTELLNEIQNKYGYELTYKKISPNIIGKIRIYEVVLSNEQNLRLELGDIHVKYSIFSLLKKEKNILSTIKKVELKSFNLKIDRNSNLNDLKQFAQSFKKNKRKENNFFNNTGDFEFQILKGKVIVIDNHKRVSIFINDLSATFKEGILINSVITLSQEHYLKKPLSVSIKTNGLINTINNELTTNFVVDFFDLNYGSLRIKDQEFTFKSTGKNFDIARKEDSLPINLGVHKKNDDFTLDIDVDRLSIEKIFTPNYKNKFIPAYVTVQSNLTFDKNFSKNSGKLDLAVHYDELFAFKNFSLTSTLEIADNLLSIKNISLSNINKNHAIIVSGDIPLSNFKDNSFNLLLNISDFKINSTHLNSKIYLVKNKHYFRTFTENFLINDSDLGGFDFNASLYNDIFYINTAEDFNGYALSGNVSRKNKKVALNLNHTFDNFSLLKIINAYNKKITKDIFLSGEIKNSLSNKTFTIPRSTLSVHNNTKTFSDIAFQMYNKLFYIPEVIINTKKDPIQLTGWVNLKDKPLRSNIKISNDAFNFDIYSRLTDNKLNISLDKNLFASLNLEKKYLYLSAKKYTLPIQAKRNNNINVSFDLVYYLKHKTIPPTNVYVKNINIFKNLTGDIKTKISVKNNQLKIGDFEYTDKFNTVIGEMVNDFNLKEGTLTGRGFFKDDEKEESYSLDYNLEDNIINAKMFLTHIDIKKFVQSNITGKINARLNVSGPLKQPEIDVEGDISEGKLKDKDLHAMFILKKDAKNITIKRATIQIADNRILFKNSRIYDLDTPSKKLDFKGSIYLEGLKKVLKTRVNVTGNIDTVDKKVENIDIGLDLQNLTLGYMENDVITKAEKYDSIAFKLKKVDNLLNFTNTGENRIIDITKTNDQLRINLFNQNDIIMNSLITLKEGTLDGFAEFKKFPVNSINRLLLPFVNLNEGLIDGKIDIKGKNKEPEFYGNLNVYYGRVELPDYLQDPITNISGIVIADKNKFLVRNVNANSRKGLAHGYGEILFNGWKFERFQFHINSNTVPCKITQGPVDARGFGYIEDLIIEGRPGNFNFIGNLVLESADVNLEGFMGAGKKRDLKKLPINVFFTFKSGKKIKVNYPIITGILNENETFILKFVGEESKLYLGGNVSLKKGEVNYLNRNFKIEYATFQFFEDELKINPLVNLKAYWRTKDINNDTAKIYLNMTERLLPIKTTFTSFPHKSEEEINNLLGLTYAWNTSNDNPISDTQNNPDSIDTLVTTTNYISNSFILNPIENRIRKATGLDTFSLDTKLFGNIIKSNTNFEYSLNTLDLLDETSLTVGKYLFNELYFESMVSFNKKNAPSENLFLPFYDQNYGLNLQLMLQLELPYVMIGYSFLPNDYRDLKNIEHKFSIEANFRF